MSKDKKRELEKPYKINWIKLIFMLVGFIAGMVFLLTQISGRLTDGLISYYPFDEPSGTTSYDNLSYSNGTVIGPTVNQAGKLGKAYDYDGTNDYVNLTYAKVPTGDGSFSVWLNPDAWLGGGGAENQVVISSGKAASDPYCMFYIDTDGQFATNCNGVSVTSTNIVANDTWTHVVYTSDGSNSHMYINGVNQTLIGTDGGQWFDDPAGMIYFAVGVLYRSSNFGEFNGGIDELGIWDRELTQAEVTELYNSGNGLSINDLFKIPSPTVTLNSPGNASLQTNSTINFNASMNLSYPGDIEFKNATIYIWYNNGTLFNSTLVSGLSGNTTDVVREIGGLRSGNYYWNAKGCYSNATFGNCTWATVNYSLSIETRVLIKITDINLALVSDGIATVGGASYLTNTIYLGENTLNTLNGTILNVNASSLGGYYNDNNTQLTIDSTILIYNVTLSPYWLWLNFTFINKTAMNVSCYIVDLNRSIVNTSNIFTMKQENFINDLVLIRIIRGTYNLPTYLTWENKSQFYEYDNNNPYEVRENISIFQDVDTVSYFQTVDNANNVIKNVKIRVYGVIPLGLFSGQSTYGFFGQRFTDNNGMTVFPLQADMELYVTAYKEGYELKTVRITASEIETYTSDNPYKIRMEKSPYEFKQDVFLGDLYKVEGNRIYPSRWDNLSSDYYMFVYDWYNRGIKYETSYEGINYSVDIDGTTKSGIISLLSGVQFSSASNDTWYLYLYVDDIMKYNVTFRYGYYEQTTLIDTEQLGFRDTNGWRAVLFFLLVGVSALIGLMFSGGGDEGLHAFFIGTFVVGLAADGMGWLTFTGAFFYLSKLIKTWISE